MSAITAASIILRLFTTSGSSSPGRAHTSDWWAALRHRSHLLAFLAFPVKQTRRIYLGPNDCRHVGHELWEAFRFLGSEHPNVQGVALQRRGECAWRQTLSVISLPQASLVQGEDRPRFSVPGSTWGGWVSSSLPCSWPVALCVPAWPESMVGMCKRVPPSRMPC